MKKICDDNLLFEILMLEAFAAGLNRKMIQNRKDAYKRAFKGFDIRKVSKMTEKNVMKLLEEKSGIIRNRRKITSMILNAQSALSLQKEYGSFSKYIWSLYSGGKIPFHSEKSRLIGEQISKNLKGRGFSFTGPSACRTFIHIIGMVDIPEDISREYEEKMRS